MAATAKRVRSRRSAARPGTTSSLATSSQASQPASAVVRGARKPSAGSVPKNSSAHELPTPPDAPTSGVLADWHRAFDHQRKILNQLAQLVHAQADALRLQQDAADDDYQKQRRLVRQKTAEVSKALRLDAVAY